MVPLAGGPLGTFSRGAHGEGIGLADEQGRYRSLRFPVDLYEGGLRLSAGAWQRSTGGTPRRRSPGDFYEGGLRGSAGAWQRSTGALLGRRPVTGGMVGSVRGAVGRRSPGDHFEGGLAGLGRGLAEEHGRYHWFLRQNGFEPNREVIHYVLQLYHAVSTLPRYWKDRGQTFVFWQPHTSMFGDAGLWGASQVPCRPLIAHIPHIPDPCTRDERSLGSLAGPLPSF